MEFALSEEQELLVDSVSKMLASACSVDELRSQASGEIVSVSYTHLTLPTSDLV